MEAARGNAGKVSYFQSESGARRPSSLNVRQRMKSTPHTSFCVSMLIIFGLAFAGCAHETRPLYRDSLVEVTEHLSIQILNVHGSTSKSVLTIWGRTFDEVRGQDPYYLQLPGRPIVLFVTGRDFDDGQATVHLANTLTHEIRSFPAYDSHIGSNIGMKYEFERVTSLTDDILVIEANLSDRKYRYRIDLREPRFIREEADFLDSNMTHKWEHYVYEGGKKPN